MGGGAVAAVCFADLVALFALTFRGALFGPVSHD